MMNKLKEVLYYARAFVVWTLMAAAVGAVCGVVGGAFAIVVEEATHLRQHVSWLPWLMPVAGLLIAGLYKLQEQPSSSGKRRKRRSKKDVRDAGSAILFIVALAMAVLSAILHFMTVNKLEQKLNLA